MKKSKRKKKLKKKRLFFAILLFFALIAGFYLLLKGGINLTKKVSIIDNTYYLANNINTIQLYEYDEEEKKLIKSDELARGSKVKSSMKTSKTEGEVTYYLIKYNDKKYYVEKKYLVEEVEKCVMEKQLFVRTSVTVYKNESDSKILSFIKKGNSVNIVGYDSIDSSGKVNMYKIKSSDTEGWVYGKYLVNTQEDADLVYNENGVYDTHKDRKYSRELYGGKASTLDYYPYEKPNFDDNILLKEAKTLYLNAGVIGSVDSYIELAISSGINAIVVDLKDGALGYDMDVAKEYSMTAYNNAINSKDDYKAAIDKIKKAGLYVIGRIVVFNDEHYAKDHPEDCINSSGWPSAFSRNVWEYNVELAIEAVNEMGFNEIQFDYVRFPENAYNLSTSGADFKNTYSEEKAEAVQNFLFYAADQIHKVGAYLSVDVFGECSSEYVTAYGQYWPAISNIVDVISSMPYTDHFGRSIDTWSDPYTTVYNWAIGASKRQKEIPTPAVARTWITAYDTPYWNVSVIYDSSKIADQIQALYDAGLTGGFLTWNGKSSLAKYNQISAAFGKTYS